MISASGQVDASALGRHETLLALEALQRVHVQRVGALRDPRLPRGRIADRRRAADAWRRVAHDARHVVDLRSRHHGRDRRRRGRCRQGGCLGVAHQDDAPDGPNALRDRCLDLGVFLDVAALRIDRDHAREEKQADGDSHQNPDHEHEVVEELRVLLAQSAAPSRKSRDYNLIAAAVVRARGRGSAVAGPRQRVALRLPRCLARSAIVRATFSTRTQLRADSCQRSAARLSSARSSPPRLTQRQSARVSSRALSLPRRASCRSRAASTCAQRRRLAGGRRSARCPRSSRAAPRYASRIDRAAAPRCGPDSARACAASNCSDPCRRRDSRTDTGSSRR